MIFKSKKQLVRRQYTIVELLVVLVIAGLLTGLTVGGIKGALARQGAAGAVRTLSSKISLARSFAVSNNRYVALLLPDYDKLDDIEANVGNNDDGYSLSSHTTFNKPYYSFTKNRLCYVVKNSTSGNYEFDRWVSGYEWQNLPSKTIAFITLQGANDAESKAVQVLKVPDPTASGDKGCTALIFKPSGALINANQVIVRVFRAAYLPKQEDEKFYWQGAENRNKGWKIVVNGFTGRTSFYLGGETINE